MKRVFIFEHLFLIVLLTIRHITEADVDIYDAIPESETRDLRVGCNDWHD